MIPKCILQKAKLVIFLIVATARQVYLANTDHYFESLRAPVIGKESAVALEPDSIDSLAVLIPQKYPTRSEKPYNGVVMVVDTGPVQVWIPASRH